MPPNSIQAAVTADLQRAPHDVRESALAATAIKLAATLDEGAGMSTAAVARELRAVMGQLLAYAVAEESTVDDLAKRRADRQATVSQRATSVDVGGPGSG